MARNATNELLHKAKKSKSDEFYTQLSDIESELQYYKEHFKNKTVYCNCDDPQISNFFRYFILNFKILGLKKLIVSCYKEKVSDLFNTESNENGFFFEYTGTKGESEKPSLADVVYFKGDGDFRSLESINLLKQSDIVVLPSRYEGLSMFALEGLATGNTVIFSKTGGLIDLVDGNGLFFEPQDIDSLVEALVKISNLPKDEIIKMKSKSIEIVKEKFIPFIVAKKFNSILNIIGS